jgi:hypothetical protein
MLEVRSGGAELCIMEIRHVPYKKKKLISTYKYEFLLLLQPANHLNIKAAKPMSLFIP